MRIAIDIAGGLAPPLMGRHYVIDTATLAESQRRALEELADRARSEVQRPARRSARDIRSYQIRLEDPAGDDVVIMTYDGAVPPATRQLIDLVASLSRR
jgi:hypothetical protein